MLVVSLAVLADRTADWRPSSYYEELWEYRSGIDFPVVKLLDFEARREELETSSNPFAAFLLAQLDVLSSRRRPEERAQRKVQLIKGLYQRGLSRDDARELLRLIDWLIVLPPELEEKVEAEVARYGEEQSMTYVTTWERSTMRRDLIEILDARCGEVPVSLAERIRQVRDAERLRQLLRVAAVANSLSAFERELRA